MLIVYGKITLLLCDIIYYIIFDYEDSISFI